MNLLSRRAWIRVLASACVLAAGCAAWQPVGPRVLRDQVIASPQHAAAHVGAAARALAAARSAGELLALAAAQRPGTAPASTPISTAGWCRLDTLPTPLASALADLLRAIGAAEAHRVQALQALPDAARSPQALVAELTQPAAPRSPSLLAAAMAAVDQRVLAAGMGVLLDAVDRFVHATRATPPPPLRWQCATPLGLVVIDTTGADDVHQLANPLFVYDSGGNDRYVFHRRDAARRITILLDASGADRYEAANPGTDASAGILGYGLVRDLAGDDAYSAGWLGQAAALAGIGWLQDDDGDDHYQARGFSQAFALAGLAVLVDGRGDDRYQASTYSQASAMGAAVALLLDREGDDRYLLAGTPLVLPSAQLPDRNASMGQGAGRGSDAPGVPHGLGMLLDLGGRDRYRAEVFAQGAGYGGGMGVLFDAGGADAYEAAWYAMGAAAHGGVGVLVDHGQDDDTYAASHSTALAAAHDGALAVFHDAGGDDRYRIGTFGFATASDGSEAWFTDVTGRDDYGVTAACIAFGATAGSPSSEVRFRASPQATGAACAR